MLSFQVSPSQKGKKKKISRFTFLFLPTGKTIGCKRVIIIETPKKQIKRGT